MKMETHIEPFYREKKKTFILTLILCILCFSFIALADHDTAYISQTQSHTQTGRVDSDSGDVRLYGGASNNALFSILKYTNIYATTGVYQSSPQTYITTSWLNYLGLAYAGYMQPAVGYSGIEGYVAVETQ